MSVKDTIKKESIKQNKDFNSLKELSARQKKKIAAGKIDERSRYISIEPYKGVPVVVFTTYTSKDNSNEIKLDTGKAIHPAWQTTTTINTSAESVGKFKEKFGDTSFVSLLTDE